MRNNVYIIGGGMSLENFDFSKVSDKNVIAVNKSIFSVPNAKFFITMDYTFLNKIKTSYNEFMEHKATKVFIANFSKEYLVEKNGTIKDIRMNLLYDLKDFDVIIKSRNEDGIGFEMNDFRSGGNSAYCALQLAVCEGYKNIYLLGIDLMCGNKTHFHGGYNQDKYVFIKNLDNYYKNFVIGLEHIKQNRPNINIYNCSEISRLKDLLPYYPQDEIC